MYKTIKLWHISSARSLSRMLEWRYHGVAWPYTNGPVSQLLTHILKRINEASGPYQMFSVLADVVILKEWESPVSFIIVQ